MDFYERTDRLVKAIQKYEEATGDGFGSMEVPWGNLTEEDVIKVLEDHTARKKRINYVKQWNAADGVTALSDATYNK